MPTKQSILLALCILAFATAAEALPSVAQSAINQSGGTASISATMSVGNVTAGDAVVVVCSGANPTGGCNNPTVNNSVTESWVSCPTNPVVQTTLSGSNYLSCHYVLSAAGGWNIVTCNATFSTSAIGCVAWDIANCTSCTFQTVNSVKDVFCSTICSGAGGRIAAPSGIILSYVSMEGGGLISSIDTGSWVEDGANNASTTGHGFAHYINPPLSNQVPTVTFTTARDEIGLAVLLSPPPHRHRVFGGIF